MPKEVIVALIAAFGSLAVSVIALTTAWFTARYNGRLQRQLEVQKATIANEALATAIADKELHAGLDALQRGVASIQALKDEIQLVLSSVAGSLPAESLVKRVIERRDTLMRTYEECSAVLLRQDDRAMHQAKNLGFALSHFVETGPPAYADTGVLSAQYAGQLSRIRDGLSEAQQVLRDSRSERLARRLLVHTHNWPEPSK